jgi:hypothetical protein
MIVPNREPILATGAPPASIAVAHRREHCPNYQTCR